MKIETLKTLILVTVAILVISEVASVLSQQYLGKVG